MGRKIRAIKSERGQSMVELALMVTVLLVLLAGTVDLGRAFFTWLAMRDAAQEGATYATISPPSGDFTCDSTTASPGPQICRRVWDNLEQVVQVPKNSIVINVDLEGTPCAGIGTHEITVDVNYPTFPLAMPFLGAVLGSQTIPIHATINDSILKPMCP